MIAIVNDNNNNSDNDIDNDNNNNNNNNNNNVLKIIISLLTYSKQIAICKLKVEKKKNY